MSLKNRALGLKRLSLHELEKAESSSVYVINASQPRGHINLTVSDGMGKPVAVRAPISYIPVDLSYQATKQNLIGSPAFRTLVAKKVLLIVESDAATAFNGTDSDARGENARLYSVGEISEVGDASYNQDYQQVQAETSGDINPFAMMMALETSMSDEEIIRDLTARVDEFNEADFTYLATTSKMEKVKAWAAEKANAQR